MSVFLWQHSWQNGRFFSKRTTYKSYAVSFSNSIFVIVETGQLL
jgi:hypothetical protein